MKFLSQRREICQYSIKKYLKYKINIRKSNTTSNSKINIRARSFFDRELLNYSFKFSESCWSDVLHIHCIDRYSSFICELFFLVNIVIGTSTQCALSSKVHCECRCFFAVCENYAIGNLQRYYGWSFNS